MAKTRKTTLACNRHWRHQWRCLFVLKLARHSRISEEGPLALPNHQTAKEHYQRRSRILSLSNWVNWLGRYASSLPRFSKPQSNTKWNWHSSGISRIQTISLLSKRWKSQSIWVSSTFHLNFTVSRICESCFRFFFEQQSTEQRKWKIMVVIHVIKINCKYLWNDLMWYFQMSDLVFQACFVKYYKRGNISGGNRVTPLLG